MSVFVLDRRGKPLMPCREKRARKLLATGRARVHRMVPFVIRLVDRHADSCAFQLLRAKLDPGSQVVQGISHKHCRIIQRSDGYGYSRIATQKGEARTVGHVARVALSILGLKAEVSRAN